MAIRVNPKLIEDLSRFGAEDVHMCYHCGDCSAVCIHSDEMFRFPRKSTRLLQMGLERKLETSLEPWLCYYCGQCSEQCPREAAPGETMMSIRRWLIARYDLTGIAGLFFRSKVAEILAIIIVALLTGIFFLYYGFTFGNIKIYDGPNAFLESSFIHKFDLILGSVLGIFLLINALRMWYLIMVKGNIIPTPWWLYIKQIYLLPWHFFSQKRYAKCESTNSNNVHMPWLVHLGLMIGYVLMLILVMVFLPALQQGPEIQWSVHIFGYLASIGLIGGSVYFIYSRRKKQQIQYQKSHSTDWVFIILLGIIIITGVTQHILHRSGLFEAANIVYVVHLMSVVPWLFRMPFSKWAHLIYRPLAMYFAAIWAEAFELQNYPQNVIPITQN